MKILLVNCVYAYGSTGKIVRDIAVGLHEAGHEVTVAYGRGRAPREPWRVVKLAPEGVMRAQSLLSKITGRAYGCSPVSTYRLLRLIDEVQPDVVNLHCINANTTNQAATIARLKRSGVKTVLTIHAEFPYTGGCGHAYDCTGWLTGCRRCPQWRAAGSQLPSSWLFCRTALEWQRLAAAYEGFEGLTITCVSPWLAGRVAQSPFFKGRRVVSVLNGLDADVFRPRPADELRHRHGLEGKKVLLHVTPNFYSPIKGGTYVLEVARRLEADLPEARVVICGYRGDGSDLPHNVTAVPFTRDQVELAEYYSMADATLLTSRRETFSMVTAETLCCGTPLVAFRAGGPESIAPPQGAIFCDYADTDGLYAAVRSVLQGTAKVPVDVHDAHQRYSRNTMTQSYINVYENIANHE